MKIVVKECSRDIFLVYLMTDTNKSIKCGIANGENEKKRIIFDYAEELLNNKNVENGVEFNLNYTNYVEVNLKKFTDAKVLNQPTYE